MGFICASNLFRVLPNIRQHDKMNTKEIKVESAWELQRTAQWHSKGILWKEEPMKRIG